MDKTNIGSTADSTNQPLYAEDSAGKKDSWRQWYVDFIFAQFYEIIIIFPIFRNIFYIKVYDK